MKNKLSNQSTELIRQILAERPEIHRGETEIKRNFETGESFLSTQAAASLAAGKADCYGIGHDVADVLTTNLDASSKSLEIGCGLSTLVFALCGSTHVCVTPSEKEVANLTAYAKKKGISLDKTSFAIAPSDKYLPTCDLADLDLVFIDGKHAFPWPMIDWFYTVDRLKQGGVLILDDTHMISGGILVDFMNSDPRWKLMENFDGKTVAFKKMVKSVHDVAWHMQPYIVNAMRKSSGPKRPLIKRIINKGRKILKPR